VTALTNNLIVTDVGWCVFQPDCSHYDTRRWKPPPVMGPTSRRTTLLFCRSFAGGKRRAHEKDPLRLKTRVCRKALPQPKSLRAWSVVGPSLTLGGRCPPAVGRERSARLRQVQHALCFAQGLPTLVPARAPLRLGWNTVLQAGAAPHLRGGDAVHAGRGAAEPGRGAAAAGGHRARRPHPHPAPAGATAGPGALAG
jgi:hypothetical protein